MPTVLPQGDVFGRIGKSIGEGISQQIPKEIERSRLSEGLKKISPELGELSRIPGLAENPALLQQALQYVQSNRDRMAAQNLAKLNQQRSPVTSSALPEGTAASQVPSNGVVPPKLDRDSSNYLIPLTPQEVNSQAEQLVQSTPGLLFGDAVKRVEEADQKRVATETAFEGRNNLAETEFTNYLNRALQTPEGQPYKDIIGEMQTEYLTKVQDLVKSGKTPRQAAKSVADELLDFAKTRGQVTTQGLKRFYSISPSEARRSINDIRKSYQDKERLDLFRNDLISKIGMSPEFADSVAFPIQNNKNIASEIKNIGVLNRLGKKEQLFQNIEDNIGDNDSINAISLALYERGVNQNDFREKISKDYQDGKIRLNQRQVRELGDAIKSYSPSLTDIWYTSLWGKTHKL